ATSSDASAAWRLVVGCALFSAYGFAVHRLLVPGDTGTWTQLVVAWLYLMPLWAVLTAWLGRDQAEEPLAIPKTTAPELLRVAMCATAATFLVALQAWQSWTWIPLALVTWGLALAADVVERGGADLVGLARRALAVFLVFHYVCLGWVFFRAGSFEN